ncbi:Ldh family oxidoreductase [Pseudorhodoplanes sp.]|uniref:Ldh family oxidoreductase n=1 Tax=Pseudorhodoplanes sp. TaxID=1934341 RepID=UPI002C30C8C3|nr:Ldh family oxidoreductase [Pseudorhodoplanes sp.]HWV55697.1 Ldh family oxidoreductase [Pseudorhodoplanes sp.]
MSAASGAIPDRVRVDAKRLTDVVARIFVALGIAKADADIVANDLVLAELEGVSSHGVMLMPMYVDRILNGSVSKRSEGDIVSDVRTSIVIDADNALGQLTAHQAAKIATERAKNAGTAVVAVRNAFHFGTAGRYARLIAEQGCVGIVMSNTRPLMPAPGGAEAITGNNPVAIALPSAGDFPVEVDMALSATAMGKIRLAAAAGQSIPADWAMAADGQPTTDPNEAIKGMLAPAAGPKGFGLAFIIDLLCGGLSGGAIGSEVRPLYGDATEPYRCSQLFIAIDTAPFPDGAAFPQRVNEQAQRVSASRRAPGTVRVYAPGELAHGTREANAGRCTLSRQTLNGLVEAGRRAGIDIEHSL